MMDWDDLNASERRAIESLRKLAKRWPKTLYLFSNSGTLEVHKADDGGAVCDATLVDNIYGIRNDGGDRDP